MEKIKVLHFELSDTIGGIETFVLNVYKYIDREKFQFDKPVFEDEIIKLGGKVFKVNSLSNPFAYANDVMRVLKNNDYNIFHIHKNSALNIIPFILVRFKYKNGIVSHSHNTFPTTCLYLKPIHYINRIYVNYVSSYKFACSNKAGNWLYGNNYFEVVMNGIDTERFLFNLSKRDRIRKEFQIPEKSIVYGHVGRFIEQKNHNKLIKIFKNINVMNPSTYLILVGKGELINKIQLLVDRLGISQKVLFLGERSDIQDIYCAMDAFIMPSVYEGLPISAIEAQASGLFTYLSSTISNQAQLTKSVYWYSIEDDDYLIAQMISKKTTLNEFYDNRVLDNYQVKNLNYDIKSTVEHVEKIYQSIMR